LLFNLDPSTPYSKRGLFPQLNLVIITISS
jgi:hypothetical protein